MYIQSCNGSSNSSSDNSFGDWGVNNFAKSSLEREEFLEFFSVESSLDTGFGSSLGDWGANN
jgi:hypothetical protein